MSLLDEATSSADIITSLPSSGLFSLALTPSAEGDYEELSPRRAPRRDLINVTGKTLTKLRTTPSPPRINNNGGDSPLLRAPVEIRSIIYAYVDDLTEGFMANIAGDGKVAFTCSALVCANKQIQSEYVKDCKSKQ